MYPSDILAVARIDIDHADHAYRRASLAELAAAGLPEAAILAAVQDHLKLRLDQDAEAVRTRVITPGTGQALEYREAQDQAVAALKAPASATAEQYPMLAVTIGIDVDPETGAAATDILGVARSVQAARDAWLAVGAAIRGARLQGKAAIGAAETPEAAAAAYLAIVWPALPG